MHMLFLQLLFNLSFWVSDGNTMYNLQKCFSWSGVHFALYDHIVIVLLIS